MDENNQNTQPTIDYDRLAEIVAGKQSVTEESVLKGYFKQQGLSGEEMQQAIDAYKADRKAKTPDVNALNQQITDANTRATQAELKLEAYTMAGELGVSAKTIPYLLRMADLSSSIENGQISQDKLKEALNNVLNDLPQLKEKAEEAAGFKIGGQGGDPARTNSEELARIFGVAKKGK